MSVISFLLVIAIVGFLVWLILQIPMPAPFKNIIIGIVCLVLVIWVLQQFGIATGLPSIRLK